MTHRLAAALMAKASELLAEPPDLKMIEILANRQVLQAIVAGEDPHRIAQDWQEQLDEFMKLRAKYLQYH